MIHKSVSMRLTQIENPWHTWVRLGRFVQGLKRRWRGFFRGARRVVSGIHRDADGFHPSHRFNKERNIRRNEMEAGVGCCIRTRTLFFPRLSLFLLVLCSVSTLLFSTGVLSPRSFALFLYLLQHSSSSSSSSLILRNKYSCFYFIPRSLVRSLLSTFSVFSVLRIVRCYFYFIPVRSLISSFFSLIFFSQSPILVLCLSLSLSRSLSSFAHERRRTCYVEQA